MGLFQDTCQSIVERNKEIEYIVAERWDEASSASGYGRLVSVVAQYAAATEQVEVSIPKPCMVIASADHGVARMGVSAYPMETTVGMTQNYLIPKGAGANALANYCGADMEILDMGIAADMSWVPGLRSHKLGMATKNFLEEPAMTREQAIEGIEVGIALVQEKVAQGYNVFLVGEMGIANTTSSALMTAKFAGLTAEKATGRGSNISDERLKVKQRIVHDVLEKYKDNPKYFLTTKAHSSYADVQYAQDSLLIFGKETAGLPETLLHEYPESCIRIPMIEDARSLNLSNSVAIVAYEALRQNGFADLTLYGGEYK